MLRSALLVIATTMIVAGVCVAADQPAIFRSGRAFVRLSVRGGWLTLTDTDHFVRNSVNP